MANPLTDPGAQIADFPPSMYTGGAKQTYLDNKVGQVSDGSTPDKLGYGTTGVNPKFDGVPGEGA